MVRQPSAEVLHSAFDPELQFNINEMFFSIQGEGTRMGRPCVFVRLQGCSLRCTWCDTSYALDHRSGGDWMSAAQLIARIESWPCRFVEFTGGDPLEQEAIYPLMRELCDRGYEVAIETGGHMDAQYVDERVVRIIDIKCPDSRMHSLNHPLNLQHIRTSDEFKFVIASRTDYDFAVEIVRRVDLCNRAAAVLFSPVFGLQDARELSEWILQDGLDVRLQLQLHKFIWSPETRGV